MAIGDPVTLENTFPSAKVIPTSNFPSKLLSSLTVRKVEYGELNTKNIVHRGSGIIEIEVNWYKSDGTFATRFYSRIDNRGLHLCHLSAGEFDLERTLANLDKLGEKYG